ncbi:MAG TPA: hypothetical protein VNZ26_21255, partial [Vicinamibacterales bacterium]|nr:hypothetical protein [Vicinamibacterales bacterium]
MISTRPEIKFEGERDANMIATKQRIAVGAIALVGVAGAAIAYRAGRHPVGPVGRVGPEGSVAPAGNDATPSRNGPIASVAPEVSHPLNVLSPDASDPLNVLSLDMGARVESVTSQYDDLDWDARRVLDSSPRGWSSKNGATLPQDLVFSFLGRQSVLVAEVLINPATPEPNARWAKNVEIWSSMQSPTEGFTKIASATLSGDRLDQKVAIEPFETRYLELRVLASQQSPDYVQVGKVKVIEGRRAGYVSLADRNTPLTAWLKGRTADSTLSNGQSHGES